MTPQELIAANIENGQVLDRRGRWVSIEEALVEEHRIRHHLEKGEVLVERHWVSIESQLSAEAKGVATVSKPAAPIAAAAARTGDGDEVEETAELDTRMVTTVESRESAVLQAGKTGEEAEQGADDELARKTVLLSASGELEVAEIEAMEDEGASRQLSTAAEPPAANPALPAPVPPPPDGQAGAEDWEPAADSGRRLKLLGIIAAALALAASGWLVAQKLF